MRRQSALCVDSVAPLQRVEEQVMLGVDQLCIALRKRPIEHPAILLRRVPTALDELQHARKWRRRVTQKVETAIEIEPILWIGRRSRMVEDGEGTGYPPQLSQPIVRQARGAFENHHRLELLADPVRLVGLAEIELRHTRAALRDDVDEAFVLELAKRLPYRNPARAELPRYGFLGDPFARRQYPIENRIPQMPNNGICRPLSLAGSGGSNRY